MLGLLLLAAAAAASAPPVVPVAASAGITYDSADEAAARDWIRRDGHAFDFATLSETDLDGVAQRLDAAQVIGIGEATHGTHQDQAFKAELVKNLVQKGGVTVFILECNRAAAVAFDRYIVTGIGDPVALVQSPRFFASWKNDAFGGLLLWLRAWNRTATKPVRIIGIDDQDSAVDASAALSFLERHDPARAKLLRSRFAPLLADDPMQRKRFFDWVASTEQKDYLQVQDASTELRKVLNEAPPAWRSDEDFTESRYAAEVAWQGLYIFERDYKGSTLDQGDLAYLGRRDRLLADNLSAHLAGDRAIFWAHDMHVASSASPKVLAAGYRPVGDYVRTLLGARYKTVGFTWSSAVVHAVSLTDGTPPPTGERIYSDIKLSNDYPGNFGHVFSPLLGDSWWIDLMSRPHTQALDRWGSRELFHGFVGWGLDPTKFQTDPDDDMTNPPDIGFDVMVWFRTMSPSRSWPAAPAD